MAELWEQFIEDCLVKGYLKSPRFILTQTEQNDKRSINARDWIQRCVHVVLLSDICYFAPDIWNSLISCQILV